MTLIAAQDQAVHTECEATKAVIAKQLAEKNIELITNAKVSEVTSEGVLLADGRFIEGNAPIWATGAEPQSVTAESDLE